jgi:hypothetical protein
VIKHLVAASVAVVGLAAGSSAQAYTVDFGQSANGTEFPLPPPASPPIAGETFNFAAAIEARNNFILRSLGTPWVQDFEALTLGSPLPEFIFGGTSPADALVTATITGSGVLERVPDGEVMNQGRYSVAASGAQGRQYLKASATEDGKAFEFAFSRDVVQFGFFGVDIGDFFGQLELDLLDANGATLRTVKLTDDPSSDGPIDCSTVDGPTCTPADGSVLYLGITASGSVGSEYFRGVRFRTLGGRSADDFAFDSFTVVGAPGTAPPTPMSAPATLALVGVALAGLALQRRRS